MAALRKTALRVGVNYLRDFHFHRSRCTFGTELATLALKVGGDVNAIAFVRDALLHRDEATTFRYIKFVKKIPIKETASNEFTKAFIGAIRRT